jgi:ABC-type bacteriocin/lantibiotic exporter with double-glycine peptidase domain
MKYYKNINYVGRKNNLAVSFTLDSLFNLIIWLLGIVIIVVVVCIPFYIIYFWWNNNRIKKKIEKELKGGDLDAYKATEEINRIRNRESGFTEDRKLRELEAKRRELVSQTDAIKREFEGGYGVQKSTPDNPISTGRKIKLH